MSLCWCIRQCDWITFLFSRSTFSISVMFQCSTEKPYDRVGTTNNIRVDGVDCVFAGKFTLQDHLDAGEVLSRWISVVYLFMKVYSVEIYVS